MAISVELELGFFINRLNAKDLDKLFVIADIF